MYIVYYLCFFFFFKQKTAYEITASDWSSDVCSSDLVARLVPGELRTPIAQVTAWLPAVPGAAVPKAAVNEERNALPPENEVWSAGERLMAAPACDAAGTENPGDF